MNIMVFGELEEITGTAMLVLNNIPDTDRLLEELYTRYPALKEKQFLIAAGQQVIRENTAIGEQTTIALLPPFSGG